MILVTLAYREGWRYVRTVDDVMVIKPRFLASMGYHIFLTMVLHSRVRRARSSAKGLAERSQHFNATLLHDVATCVEWTGQTHATYRNRVAKRTQHVVPNNVARSRKGYVYTT